ncbi:hypothetical protein LV457_05785 [Mycobacterium sp. MYCO198283]|uniref:hypothetical protein n=1 Tax=Mycobacterium sp. MYCO198283 TaxID=2883505 RepID=UPI001E29E4D1|nr:hypothetical protein [Mycobacterium sp. MYCO198283]MCG5431802.1 hypothetical protein [Mycobacterium sp. MYCO198283]
MTDLPGQLRQLPAEAVMQLDAEFSMLSRLPTAHTAAAWADGWCWRIQWDLGLDQRHLDPPGLDTLRLGELVVLRDHFGQSRWCCSPIPALAQWCRQLVEALVDEFDRRAWVRANEEARFQIIAAEENRRAREGKPPPDLRGLPTWKEISTPPADS